MSEPDLEEPARRHLAVARAGRPEEPEMGARALAGSLALGVALACAAPGPVSTAPGSPADGARQAQVLVVTARAGFHHESIPVAARTLVRLGARSGRYEVTFSNRLDRWSPAYLARFDVVVFANTSGELPLTAAQRAALIRFVQRGGGWVGLHAPATRSRPTGPSCAWSGPSPGTTRTRAARWCAAGPVHPATRAVPARWPVADLEVYRFHTDPRARGKRVLLSWDASTVPGAPPGERLPLAWCGRFGAGRTFYASLGHSAELWLSGTYRALVDGAIAWAAAERGAAGRAASRAARGSRASSPASGRRAWRSRWTSGRRCGRPPERPH